MPQPLAASDVVGKIIGSSRHKQEYAHLVPSFHEQLLHSYAGTRDQAQLLIVLVFHT